MPQSDLVHVENIAKISTDAARAAYLYIIRMAERIQGFRCYPGTNPDLPRNFEFHDVSGQPYAVSISPDGLIFHFRKPDVKGYSAPAALASGLEQNEAGELEIHIHDVAKAQQIMQEIFGLVDRSHIRSVA